MRRTLLLCAAASLSVLSACDEGRIYEKEVVLSSEGKSLTMTIDISGIDTWSDGYDVVVAGFDDESDYSKIAKNIVSTEGEQTVTLSGISDEVTTIEVCVINRIRERVTTFYSASVPDDDEFTLEAGTIDASMKQALVNDIFAPSCAQCHGGSNYAAAGLYLIADSIDASILYRAATCFDGMIVTPGDADESVLYQVAAGEVDDSWSRYSLHSQILVNEPLKLTLLGNWIDNMDYNEE